MVKLTKEIEEIVKILFNESERQQVNQLLKDECGKNIPFWENNSPEKMDRIRLSILKISNGDIDNLLSAIKMAQVDWRDVLMNAEFGNDIDAHKKWAKDLLKVKENDI